MYPCTYKDCGRIYSTKYSLQRHCLIRHKKSKRFSCKICKKILSSNQNLKEHVYTHNDERPLICPYINCGQLFRQSSQLSAHKKFHLLSGTAVKLPSTEPSVRVDFNHLRRFLNEKGTGEEDRVETESMVLPKLFDPDELKALLSSL